MQQAPKQLGSPIRTNTGLRRTDRNGVNAEKEMTMRVDSPKFEPRKPVQFKDVPTLRVEVAQTSLRHPDIEHQIERPYHGDSL